MMCRSDGLPARSAIVLPGSREDPFSPRRPPRRARSDHLQVIVVDLDVRLRRTSDEDRAIPRFDAVARRFPASTSSVITVPAGMSLDEDAIAWPLVNSPESDSDGPSSRPLPRADSSFRSRPHRRQLVRARSRTGGRGLQLPWSVKCFSTSSAPRAAAAAATADPSSVVGEADRTPKAREGPDRPEVDVVGRRRIDRGAPKERSCSLPGADRAPECSSIWP